ncbi:MAG: glycosyltransferase family 2 protein [Acidimicrobiales bacterium]
MFGSARAPLVDAVITNHNTSALAEVALLSFLLDSGTSDRANIRITVADNWSTDGASARLAKTAALVGAQHAKTRWPHPGADATRRLDSAGDALRDFVVSHQEADYYFFIDSDIEFYGYRTLDAMLDFYSESKNVWAVTAQLERSDALPLPQLLVDGQVHDLAIERSVGGRHGPSRKEFSGRLQPRCPHACTLIGRTETFLNLATRIGLSAAVIMSGDGDIGGFYDNFGLATRVMEVAGYRYEVAPVSVRHAFGGSWAGQHRQAREQTAERRRERLRLQLGLD